MKYKLSNEIETNEPYLRRLLRNITEIGSYVDKRAFFISVVLAFIGSMTSVVTPFLLAQGIDKYIAKNDSAGLLRLITLLSGIYVIGAVTMYCQQNIMGKASQTALYEIRGTLFEKIQSLPLAFFSQNKIGDLISRINNDSDKLSQFLSESILRFMGSVFTLFGIAVFVLYLNWKLGLVLLSSTVFLLILTRYISPKLEKANKRSSGALGTFTGGVSEQFNNFKAIIAFNRRNYFEEYLSELNRDTYRKSRLAGFLNQVFSPLYDFAGYVAQAAVLVYGVYLISQGQLTLGLLIGFLGYALRFYDPLRYMADIFGEMQVSLASWGRIRDLLSLESDLQTIKDAKESSCTMPQTVLAFEDVSFEYQAGKHVLEKISFALKEGKTYALLGPTGGGKSTIAILMSRLYDPTRGIITWKGKDIRSYEKEELAQAISVILQEPYLFTGTVAENIKYGNPKLQDVEENALLKILDEKGMTELLKRLPEGIQTHVGTGGENISIGQRQLISFVRTVLREPQLLILDEATANIDTVTESTLQHLIESLGEKTTKVIIAHRLNTIKAADEILFVSGGEVKRVSNEKEVLDLLKGASRS
jgi:ATP-binding cassette subfamily B protein